MNLEVVNFVQCGLPKPPNRFSLILLSDGEYYFEDFAADYELLLSSTDQERNTVNTRGGSSSPLFGRANIPFKETLLTPIQGRTRNRNLLKGRLKVCSKSLLFDPADQMYPIYKFPFSSIDKIELKKSSNDEFCFYARRFIEMKENNKNRPYHFEEVPNGTRRHSFILKYAQITPFLTFLQQLHSISVSSSSLNMHNSIYSYDPRLTLLITRREKELSFDPSWLVNLSEKILLEVRVDQVLPLIQNPGSLLLTNIRLYFQPVNNNADDPVKIYPLNTITRMVKQRHNLRHTGLEFYLESGASIFLDCKTSSLRDQLYDTLLQQQEVSQIQTHDQIKVLHAWQDKKLSNFDYLMYLNIMAGRTFNDIKQYPVFPWILSNYESQELDLTDPTNYRDLSKPIGALNPSRLLDFQQRYAEMPNPKFLYGTHYSTPGYVQYYLVRHVPEYMLRLQNGRFDAPSRIFHDVSETYRSVLSNPADLKELTPEFFDTSRHPDFLLNSENLDLGVRQDNTVLGDVILPPWAHKSPSLFIQKMREALESDYISEHLNQWIDLIFGYKQQGEQAIQSDNLFHHLTYEGAVDIDKIDDIDEKISLEAQISEFGQTPRRLFLQPHPKRFLSKEEREALFTSTFDAFHFIAPTTSQPQVTTHDDVLLVAHDDKKCWSQTEKLQHKFSFKLHRDDITACCLSADNETLYSVSRDSSLKIYSLSNRMQQRSINISSTGDMTLSSCLLSPSGQSVIISSWDNNIYLYSIEYGRTLETIQAHDDAVSCMCLHHDTVVSGSWDSTVKVWKLSNSSFDRVPLLDFSENEVEVRCIDISSVDGNNAISGAEDGTIQIMDLRSGNVVRSIDAHDGEPVNSVKFTPDGTRIISCSSDQTIKVFEIDGPELANLETNEELNCLATDGKEVLTGGSDGILRLWNLAHEKELMTLQTKGTAPVSPVSCLFCSTTGRKVIFGCQSGEIHYFSQD